MTTDVNFSLATILQGKAATPGVNIYAYAFDSGGSLDSSVAIVDNGSIASSPKLTLDSSFGGGSVVIVTQQAGGTALPTTPTFNTLANIGNAQAGNYRYDVVELALSGSSTDQGDLTNIVQFGAPISLTVHYTGAPDATRGYGVTGQAVVDAMNAVAPIVSANQPYTEWTGTTPFNDQRETLTAGTNLASGMQAIASPDDWNSYVSSFASFQDDTRIAYFYAGATNNAGQFTVKPSFFYYEVEHEDGYITLTPVDNEEFSTYLSQQGIPWQASSIVIRMPDTAEQQINGYGTGNALTQNVYTQTGNTLFVFPDETTADAFPKMTPAEQAKYEQTGFNPNNQYGFLSQILVTGFEAGFFGGSALPIPDAMGLSSGAPRLDLDQMWNWSGLYAYGAVGPAGGPLASFDYQSAVIGQHFDVHTVPIFQNTNAYGWSYSDFLSTFGGAVNPQVSLWDANANSGAGAQVSQIDIQLFDLADTPPSGTYQTPTLDSFFLQPTSSPVLVQAQSTGNNGYILNLDASFGVPTSTGGPVYPKLAPADGTPMQLRIFAPNDPTATGNFITIDLPASYSDYYTVYSPSEAGNPNPGKWSAVAGNPSGLQGNLIFYNLPAADDGTSWYQFVLGSGSSAKTYNIYTTQTYDQTTQAFAFTDSAADGGATAVLQASGAAGSGVLDEIKVSLTSGSTVTYDPLLWLSTGPRPTSSPAPPQTMSAPLVGVDDDGNFIAFSSLGHITQGEFAFSYNAIGDNTTDGFNFAKILLSNTAHPSWIIAPVVAQSDIDGHWLTKMGAQFGDGTYSAFMQQYKPYDLDLDKAVGAATVPVAFTVALDKLPLSATPDGHALQFTQGPSSTTGNWIELSAVSSTLLNGTLIAYATDNSGQMLMRDGSGFTNSLEDAALGRIGSVASDGGQLFFSGKQQLYLPAGQQLHFAVVAADGQVDVNPTVNVTGSGGKFNVAVSDGFGTINLSALANNTLDSSAMLAGSQRESDHAWVYLTHGSQLKVDLAWSGDYVNTLHFVRLDVDPTDSGQLRVSGVAYGNTDAFRTAVQNSWEFGATQGHSTGTSSTTWTVQGKDGYYVPVLVSGRGDIWMVENTPAATANADGHQHIRNFGANTFGIEDTHANAGADFDYNDMVMRLSLL